jgi:Cu-Zn family superoxide dismutase
MKAETSGAILCGMVLVSVALFSPTAQAQQARAVLEDRDGNRVGEVSFEETERGVRVRARVDGLEPGEHSFHIHENAACEAPDFESAGGHFNPGGTEHGFLNPKGPHAGDLLNITVAEDGTGEMNVVTDLVTLEQDRDNSLFAGNGTAVVIHREPDDYITDPAGKGGDRIACGVIESVE